MATITGIQEFVIANQGSGADAVISYINEGPWSTSTSVTVVKIGADFYATVGESKTSASIKMLLSTAINTTDTTIVASGTFGLARNVNGFKVAVPADGGYIQIGAEVIKIGTVAFSDNTAGTATCGYQVDSTEPEGQGPPAFTPYTPIQDYTTVTFSGCTRAQKSTTAASHLVAADIDEILLGTVSIINYDKSAGTFNTYANTSQRYLTEDLILEPAPLPFNGQTVNCSAPYYESRITQHLIPIPEINVTLYTIASDES
jgi:hypothetical protein